MIGSRSMIETTRLRLASTLAMLAIFCAANQTHALPPLGLTQITPSNITPSNTRAGLEIIDGTAYLNVTNGVWTVDSLGTTSFVSISHPTLGIPSSVTPVVKAFDGKLYTAANFSLGQALFQLDQPLTPNMTWEIEAAHVSGVDAQLRVLGYTYIDFDSFFAARAVKFVSNGSTELLPGEYAGDTFLFAVTPLGFALGDGGIPGTIGSAPILWAPDDSFLSYVFGYGAAGSIRDRNDGQGVNIGDIFEGLVLLGDTAYYIQDINGLGLSDDAMIVSHSNFVVALDFDFRTSSLRSLLGFFPGIIPDHPDRGLPLLDIFPQLATIDIDFITSLASVDGYLYMTLRGSDGTFLFGARDPSVIPEPTTALLLLIAIPYLGVSHAGIMASKAVRQ